MASKRHEDDRACRCHQGDPTCAALTVGRLSHERVRELAEEIWTASGGDGTPLRRAATSDPRGSQAGASAQAAYQRCRQREREAWRDGMLWRVGAVAAAALVGGSLVGLTLGASLGWRLAALAALLAWWRLRPRPSARARVWRREAAMQRRTAEALEPLRQRGFLLLHDLTLPGWPASLDHLVVGPTGVWVIQSWRRRRFARLRRATSPWTAGCGTAAQPPRLRWQAEAIADVLAGDTQLPVRPLLCVHGGGGRLAAPTPAVRDVRVASPRKVPDIVRHGPRARQDEVDPAIARLLEVLHPAV
jgi:Nuclease-related domain